MTTNVGSAAGSSGSVTITGPGSSWTSTGGQFIGLAGNGSLQILAGGTVSAGAAEIGSSANGVGTALVSGAGSRWTTTNFLFLGRNGSAKGTLTVADGGEVITREGSIGNAATTTGAATVTGAGSRWTSTGNLLIGLYGKGEFTLSNGATANTADTFAGTNTGANGMLTIDGGSSFSGANLTAGLNAGTTGTVTVAGQGTTLTSTGGHYIGRSGKGTMQVLSGATASAAAGSIGNDAVSQGTVLVSGPGSQWTLGGNLTVGNSGNGTLSISDGGAVSAAANFIGNAAGSSGRVDVTGAGSSWSTTSQYIGTTGNGTLMITGGGTSTAAGSYVATNANSTGSVTVSGAGSSWTTTGSQFIGNSGNGSLQILDGATVTGETTRVGHYAGSVGTALVSGAGSRWISTSAMNVGMFSFADGKLTVEDQGEVITKTVGIGNYVDSTGTVRVTGAGTRWSSTDNLLVGLGGTGSFTLLNGATASTVNSFVGTNLGSNGTLMIAGGGTYSGAKLTAGLGAGSEGAVTVTGAGSTLTSTVDQTIGGNGNGSLQILGGATASASAAWIGNAAGSTGAALIDGTDSRWMLAGDLVIGNAGIGVLTLSSLAELNAASIRIAEQADSFGTLNIGAAAGVAAAEAGTLNTGSIAFGSGTGTLVLNHTDNAYLLSAALSGAGKISAENGRTIIASDSSAFLGTTVVGSAATLQVGSGGTSGALGGSIANSGQLVFDRADDSVFAGAISGSGRLTKSGSGTLALTGDSSGFNGPATLAAGGLSISGALGGSVTAEGGTVLSGTGSAGGIIAQAGATITPGDAAGSDAAVFTVTGDYTQAAGATYQAGVVAQSTLSDVIAVAGSATLQQGAVLDVSRLGSGSYGLNDVYTVLTAAGGVSGSYLLTGDTAISAFYELQAVTEANAVLLKAVQIRDFADAALEENQASTAGGVSSLPQGDELRDAVGNLDSDAALRDALDHLSGEIYASSAGAVVQETRFLRTAVMDRLRCASDSTSIAAQGCADRSVWIEGYGASGDNEGDGNAAAISDNVEGFYLGADMPLSRNVRIGLVGGHGTSDVNADARGSSASNESYDFGLYGQFAWNAFALRLGGAYGWTDTATERQASFQGFSDHLSADYDSRVAQAFAEVGYGMTAGSAVFEPYAALALVDVESAAFTEKGGAAALSSTAQDTGVTLGTLGLRASATTRIFGFDVTANGMAGWQHGWGDLTPDMAFSFAGGDNFRIRGAPLARDAALVEAGLTAAAPGEGAFGIWYTGQFSDNARSGGLRASLSFRF